MGDVSEISPSQTIHVVDVVVGISLSQQYPESRFARVDSLVNTSEVRKTPDGQSEVRDMKPGGERENICIYECPSVTQADPLRYVRAADAGPFYLFRRYTRIV